MPPKKQEWIDKQVACVNVDSCNVWSKIVVAKNTALAMRSFLCGFCAHDRDAAKNREIARLKKILDEKIDGIKNTITSELDKFKTEFSAATTRPEPQNIGRHASTGGSLNIIITGVPEETGNNRPERQENLRTTVCDIMQEHETVAEEVVADYRRLGRFDKDRKRPIIVSLTSVWTKRKVLAKHQELKANSNLTYRIKEDRPSTPEFRRAKARAWELNQEIKKKAERSNKVVECSYSGRNDGSVVKYEKRAGRWHRVQDDDDEYVSAPESETSD